MFEVKDGTARAPEQTFDRKAMQHALDRRRKQATRIAENISVLQERAAKIDAEIADIESGLVALDDGSDFEPTTRRGPG